MGAIHDCMMRIRPMRRILYRPTGGGGGKVAGRWGGERAEGYFSHESWSLSMGRVSLCYSIEITEMLCVMLLCVPPPIAGTLLVNYRRRFLDNSFVDDLLLGEAAAARKIPPLRHPKRREKSRISARFPVHDVSRPSRQRSSVSNPRTRRKERPPQSTPQKSKIPSPITCLPSPIP